MRIIARNKIIEYYTNYGFGIYGGYSAFSYSVREGYTGMAYHCFFVCGNSIDSNEFTDFKKVERNVVKARN